MSLPITSTPVLKGQDAEVFLRKLANGLRNKKLLVPIPKFDKLQKEILDGTKRGKI